MGKGKGSFDHWATRMAVSQVLFELRGKVHEQVVRDAFRLAGNKLPGQYSHQSPIYIIANHFLTGQWEFVKKGDPPVVGITKLDGVTLEELKRPRRVVPTELAGTPAEPEVTESPSKTP
jgi:hypothetical protein